jgi:hypothetical protein
MIHRQTASSHDFPTQAMFPPYLFPHQHRASVKRKADLLQPDWDLLVFEEGFPFF